ncbi:MAG: N-acetylglucosamine kinase [Kordiimonadaceae bacterium]|jgi:N-acetylglucosamine kinase-like BadF-type ATPase|nr:N-acetylglucosamine kinase [Kordiimonadaceae bacterium]MBT6035659.1 N-acetylglucosamine kinase [Kordiimonadaceae bacterium]MBT6328270.1 N-acetylglucosamine kinase [Kordiimonadaceae bacterium]MBT7581523.1 N-acetylglucosamine kinase [Kordiimonadaceae bacterium]
MFIGVDSGGSKTAYILINENGKVIASHNGDTCHYLSVGTDKTRDVLAEGIKKLLAQADVELSDVKYSFFGIPSYGEDHNLTETLDKIPASFMGGIPYSCDNDMVPGWAGSLACEDGINIVAGTGSICYGENKGSKARCGGWGELFGDEGSSYWIAREGLNIFTKMSDGRLSRGPLYDKIKEHLSLDVDLDLPAVVLGQWKGDRRLIAGLSLVVGDACRAGDSYASDIFNRAGRELAEIVEATRCELGFLADDPVMLSYSGGLFNAGDLILSPMKASLKSQYTLIKPRFSPVIGAALYAAKLYGSPFDVELLSD